MAGRRTPRGGILGVRPPAGLLREPGQSCAHRMYYVCDAHRYRDPSRPGRRRPRALPGWSGSGPGGGPRTRPGMARGTPRTSGASWSWRRSTAPAALRAIGEVARQLGLDRSNATRMLAAAVAAGLVTKNVSPRDARRTELGITRPAPGCWPPPAPRRPQAFARLVAGSPAADARRLASYLRRLAAESVEDPRPARAAPRRQPPAPPSQEPAMTIVLNHTIVPVGDKRARRPALAGLLALQVGAPAGRFVPARINDDLTFDFDDRLGARPGHYAFLVDDRVFDRALEQARGSGLDWGSAPRRRWAGRPSGRRPRRLHPRPRRHRLRVLHGSPLDAGRRRVRAARRGGKGGQDSVFPGRRPGQPPRILCSAGLF